MDESQRQCENEGNWPPPTTCCMIPCTQNAQSSTSIKSRNYSSDCLELMQGMTTSGSFEIIEMF